MCFCKLLCISYFSIFANIQRTFVRFCRERHIAGRMKNVDLTYYTIYKAQSTGAIEYTDCIFAEG